MKQSPCEPHLMSRAVLLFSANSCHSIASNILHSAAGSSTNTLKFKRPFATLDLLKLVNLLNPLNSLPPLQHFILLLSTLSVHLERLQPFSPPFSFWNLESSQDSNYLEAISAMFDTSETRQVCICSAHNQSTDKYIDTENQLYSK